MVINYRNYLAEPVKQTFAFNWHKVAIRELKIGFVSRMPRDIHKIRSFNIFLSCRISFGDEISMTVGLP